MAFTGQGKRDLLRTHTHIFQRVLWLSSRLCVCVCVCMCVCVCARRHCKRERNERERELEEMGEGERERESSWLGAHRPWAAARAGKWPRPVPSCLKSAQRQPSGPDTYTWPSRCGVRSTRTAQRPRKSGSPAGTRRLRGLCLGAGRRRPRATAPLRSAYTQLEQSLPKSQSLFPN